MKTFRHDGLTFEYLEWAGDGDTVVLLHGFPQSVGTWMPIAEELSKRGLHVVALNQRGYSNGARPKHFWNYTIDLLLADIDALATNLDLHSFHLVGHDWGGVLAWLYAASRPTLVKSLSVVSTPHPGAAREAGFDGGQALRLWYTPLLVVPGLMSLLLKLSSNQIGYALLIRTFGLPSSIAHEYIDRLTNEPLALTGALNWYRGALLNPSAIFRAGKSPVPTLYLWGTEDLTVSRAAAESTAKFVSADYTYHVVEQGSHWLPETRAFELVDEICSRILTE